jgi:hypothetical protein
MAAVTSRAVKAARPALSASTAKSMPSATPWTGGKPANQYTRWPPTVPSMMVTSMPVTAAATRMATASSSHRR